MHVATLTGGAASGSVSLLRWWREEGGGARQAQLTVVSPAGQTFAYVLDSLNFNRCNSPDTADGCRTPV